MNPDVAVPALVRPHGDLLAIGREGGPSDLRLRLSDSFEPVTRTLANQSSGPTVPVSALHPRRRPQSSDS